MGRVACLIYIYIYNADMTIPTNPYYYYFNKFDLIIISWHFPLAYKIVVE
jgi:hypothetical protein